MHFLHPIELNAALPHRAQKRAVAPARARSVSVVARATATKPAPTKASPSGLAVLAKIEELGLLSKVEELGLLRWDICTCCAPHHAALPTMHKLISRHSVIVANHHFIKRPPAFFSQQA